MTPREEAAYSIVLAVANRLSDVAAVAAISATPDNIGRGPGSLPFPPWWPARLGAGHSGLAVLFAELAYYEPSAIVPAREHLRSAVADAPSVAHYAGLYSGMAGIGFAASAVARSRHDCTTIIEACDRAVVSHGSATAANIEKHPDDLDYLQFDLVTGITGMARYLLRTRGPADSDVRSLISALVKLTVSRKNDSNQDVPGWWAHPNPGLAQSGDPRNDVKQLDLGLAHGVAGTLACMSAASLAGVRLGGLEEAIERVATWLTSWYQRGQHGTNWPTSVTLQEERDGARSCTGDRGAWCYGTPGIASSLLLASNTSSQLKWRDVALESVRKILPQFDSPAGRYDAGFCHGLAGLIRILQNVQVQDRSDELQESIDRMVDRIIAMYDPSAPFGFRSDILSEQLPPNDPGMLTGVAGTALALLAYCTGGTTGTQWDEAFLLA